MCFHFEFMCYLFNLNVYICQLNTGMAKSNKILTWANPTPYKGLNYLYRILKIKALVITYSRKKQQSRGRCANKPPSPPKTILKELKILNRIKASNLLNFQE